MATLHVLSHSPFSDSRLESCLRLLAVNDALLLCGDAVYGTVPGTPASARLAPLANRLYALSEDLQGRNIEPDLSIQRIDYARFVQLSIEFDRVNTWL